MSGSKINTLLFSLFIYSLYLCLLMNKGKKEIIRVRVISAAFTALALAVFKPFGLDAWQWQAYMHLMSIFVLGVLVCLLTDAVMKYLVRMSCSMDDIRKDINYFIHYNLYFQIINTLLVALMICLYRHFVLSDRIPANQLSWGNFFETLLIIAFCSFAIGLYWRFKFRSHYLAAELEETRNLNIQLKEMQQAAESRAAVAESSNEGKTAIPSDSASTDLTDIILSGTTNETVALQVADLLYIEAVGNYVKVHHLYNGQVRSDMLRATSKQMEDELRPYPMIVRCHRAFLVNLRQVEQIVSKSGNMQLLINHCHDSIPVSRSNIPLVKAAVKGMC